MESIGYLADVASMSKSTYLREAGLQKTMRTVYDLEAIKDLAKVNGDMGRIAGLLKLWLATPDKRGVGVGSKDVVQMMDDFRNLQSIALDLMAKAIRP
ncbi:CopG family transcriptional regulator [Xanthomonas perforans]|nr:CopG family transcriptional regulator [Xanthomonas perforans]MDC9654361.1 CopG family transcriptional regulator [Xanthomonas perforans]